MKRISSYNIGMDQGTLELFSDFQDGGEMWTGSGPRKVSRAVEFSESFTAQPMVQVSLTMWDMGSDSNARADIRAENVTETGFDLVFRTWSDTRIARVSASWLAIGDVADPEQWDLY
ncbi:H-type lectin domain-containing protein [Planktomarina temperata]|nr:H-type lectin domain-containing protein [Planktomarina temperata]